MERADVERTTFVTNVIGMLEASMKSGSSKDRLSVLKDPGTAAFRVLEARFALGADDGAYLRANVMPLQTTLPGCDERPLLDGLAPEIRAATQLGVLKALEERAGQTVLEMEQKLFSTAPFVGFLLSLPIERLSGDATYQKALGMALQDVFGTTDGDDSEEVVKRVDRFQTALGRAITARDVIAPLQNLDALAVLAATLLIILVRNDRLGVEADTARAVLLEDAEALRSAARLQIDDDQIMDFLNTIPGDRSRFVKESMRRVEDAVGNVEIAMETLKQAKDQIKELETVKKAQTSDGYNRTKRMAVWNDALREACISQDRLYAFVRQLSGTISENVDAVCQIDEGLLVRQQREARESRQRLATQAAQEQMALVRNVFAAVIRDSGLSLGIESLKDKDAQLKVVSSTLRKQASELASGSAGESGGYFSNSVRLENLLASGTGEITLQELFEKLNAVGSAIQKAALGSEMDEYDESTTASLDFLSAPRNSLLLRYKPEALSAVRQAFQLFQREMQHQGGRMARRISVFELMEGNDDELCTAFATFCGHVLVHSRMYSSGTAMYIGAWPAAANAQQLKISLHRLVTCARRYSWHTSRPSFGVENGREAYFSSGGPVYLM
jgi:hypothetical protein